MNKEIKIKAWGNIEGYIGLNDEEFNTSATSFKISDDYNLAIWCDIDYEVEDTEETERYFIVSIRYNPYDDLFGDDISNFEYYTSDTSRENLEEAIDILLDGLKNKTLAKDDRGYYKLVE